MAKDRRNSNGLSRKWKLGRQEIADPVLPQGGDKPVTPVYYGYDAQVIADAPVGYWRLAAPTGQIITDSSTAGRNAFLTGNVALGQSGPIFDGSTSALFDGVTGLARVPGYDPLSGLTAFSMEGWVNHNSAAWAATIDLFLSMGTVGHYLAVSSGTVVTSTRISGVQRTSTGVAINTTGWHHIVQTWTSGDSIRLYVDGVLAATSAVFSGTLDAGTAVYIGIFEPGTASNRFAGLISRCALYNYALSPTTIATHYALRSR